MIRLVQIFSIVFFCTTSSATEVVAQDVSAVTHTASLSDFGTKIETLEQIVDDVALSAALALLGREFPDWTFERSSSFDDAEISVSNDLAGVSGHYEYDMSKLRGAIFRNGSVSDQQREQALEIFGDVTEFIHVAYELAGLIGSDQFDQAGALYRNDILSRYDELKDRIRPLSDEIEQAVKFSAL